MKLQFTFLLLLLLAVVAFAGCYTQLGYHASSDYGRVHPKHHEGLREKETEMAHADAADSAESELEHADDEDSDGYYGQRKRSYRTTYAPLTGTTPIGCLTDRIRITHHRLGIIRIVHFMDIAGTIMGIVRRITAIIAVIILIETFTGGITVGVDIHRFHGGLTKRGFAAWKSAFSEFTQCDFTFTEVEIGTSTNKGSEQKIMEESKR